eukprot:6470300-Amphidinium_carterae.1
MTTGEMGICACSTSGVLKCWGSNSRGQLGYGDTKSRGKEPNEMGDHLPAVDLGAGRTCVAVAVGEHHFCALLDNNSVKCWGGAEDGVLGYEDTGSRGSASGQMGDGLPAVALGDDCWPVHLSLASSHSCVLCAGGSVKCWGLIEESCLDETYVDSPDIMSMGNNLPTLHFGEGKTVVGLTSSDGHMCVMLSDVTVKCCGLNEYGQLGYGDRTDRHGASQMGDNLPAIDFGTRTPQSIFGAMGGRTYVFFTDGSIRAIGANAHYQLGYGDAIKRNSFGDTLPAISLGNGLHAVSGGFGHWYGA